MGSVAENFKIEKSQIIDGVYTFSPSVFEDLRGTLFTSFYNDIFKGYIPENIDFKHDKFSQSHKNVLRGIHGDHKSWKLVTAVYGRIFQVAVDCRKDSPTYMEHEVFEISSVKQKSVLLPPGIGNAFLVLSEQAVYHYKLAYEGDYIDADQQFSVKWDDPEININWPIKNPVLSNRDK